jgi:hypothetical protein
MDIYAGTSILPCTGAGVLTVSNLAQGGLTLNTSGGLAYHDTYGAGSASFITGIRNNSAGSILLTGSAYSSSSPLFTTNPAITASLLKSISYTALPVWIISNVEGKLNSVAPILGTKWHGATEALNKAYTGCACSSAHSAREVLRLLLKRLAPDSCFSPSDIKRRGDKGRITWKMRIKKVVLSRRGIDPDSDESLLICGDVVDLYRELSGIAHYEGEENPDLISELTQHLKKFPSLLSKLGLN